MKKNLGERMVVTQPTKATIETVQTLVSNQAPVSQPVAIEAPAAAPVSEPAKENLHKITSPMVGTFYQSPSPEADIYVKVGSKVSKESIVCIVEAMKLFNEIEAEVNGEIVEILVKDGQLVEYGQPLFLVKPE
jgi:acetyl-CoA carboxylase biotin carboxyl carrier protein